MYSSVLLPVFLFILFFFYHLSPIMADQQKIEVIPDDEKQLPIQQQQPAALVAPSAISLSPMAKTALPIVSYCFASILMTVTNKYVLSGFGFNMNFLLLTVQV